MYQTTYDRMRGQELILRSSTEEYCNKDEPCMRTEEETTTYAS